MITAERIWSSKELGYEAKFDITTLVFVESKVVSQVIDYYLDRSWEIEFPYEERVELLVNPKC